MNHYPRHVGDITQATFGLSLTEFGAYDRLLDAYYANEAPLPLSASERYRMAGAVSKQDRAAVDYVVAKFFVQGADGWHQKRADQEVSAYQQRTETARNNGKHGGRPNRKITQPVISGIPEPNPEGTQTKTNQEPVTSNHKPEGQKQVPRASPRRSPKTPIADDFGISDLVREWAAEKGHRQLEAHLANFRIQCMKLDYRYADWDAAFMDAIRKDWARLAEVKNGSHNPAAGRATVAEAIWKGHKNERHDDAIDGTAERVTG